MTVSSITVKKAASDAVKDSNVTPITSADYSTEEFQKFSKSVISALSAVPSSYNNGNNGKGGHAGLIIDDAKWSELIGVNNATFTPHVQPKMATLTDQSTLPAIEIAKLEYDTKLEAYFIQQGCEAGAKLLIEANVPDEALADLEDVDTGFTTVTAKQMMDHLESNATVTDVFDKEQLYASAQEPYDLEGTTSFKIYATNQKRKQKVLKSHNIILHDSIMMMPLLSQFKGHGDFKKEVEEWEVKSHTDQTWNNFVQHFDAADHARRQRNKYGKKTAGESMYANQALDMSDMKAYLSSEIDRRIGQGLTEVIDATERQLEDRAYVATQPKDHADKWTKGQADELSKLRDQLKTLEDENKKLKHGRQRSRGRRTRVTVGGESVTYDNKKKMDKKCPLCGRWHPYVAEADCWAHPDNRDKAPEGWKKADE